MPQFQGVKAKFALELTAFAGTAKMFRTRFREAGDNVHALYSPKQIREIRMKLLDIPLDTVREKELPPIIVTRTAKGGVGKSTVSDNISACFAMSGYKTLLIDGDPEATTTGVFNISWSREDVIHIGGLMKALYEKKPIHPSKAVRHVYDGGMLDLIPADITMANDSWLLANMNRGEMFVRLLEHYVEFFSQYDVIVVDCPPGSSLLATTYMVAARTLLTVVVPEANAIASLDVLESNVQEINQSFAHRGFNLDVHIVVNRYNQTKKPHNAALAALSSKMPGKINNNIVKDFVGFLRERDPEEVRDNGPLIEKEPGSIGARDIIDLSKSLVQLYDIRIAGRTPTSNLSTEATS